MRFSGRVQDYVRARPRYPDAVVDLLARETGLTPDALIADIGSGTGFSAEPFLRNGNRVIGVEPNRPMRQAGGEVLREYPHFHCLPTTAESTRLPSETIDYIVVGQAFHWFDAARARREFVRILAPGGWVVLMWNTRRLASPFMQAYESLLERFGTDYDHVARRGSQLLAREGDEVPAQIAAFYGGPVQRRVLGHEQRFDFAGLQARLLSASYVPPLDDPACEPMLAHLKDVFDIHNSEGEVLFEYELEIYFGKLEA